VAPKGVSALLANPITCSCARPLPSSWPLCRKVTVFVRWCISSRPELLLVPCPPVHESCEIVEQSVVLVLLMFKHGVVGRDCCQ
jgi:hypothetical protein